MDDASPGISILADLALLGLTARVDGDRLWVGPRANLPPGPASRIRRHKAEVVAVLRQQPGQTGDGPVGICDPRRHRRFAITQNELRKRGFRVLADKPEVVAALLGVAEEIAAELHREGRHE